MGRSYFHLHLVSDSTGETLIAASRAVTAQYVRRWRRSSMSTRLSAPAAQLERAIVDIESSPGMVLFTLVDRELIGRLTAGLPR